MENEEQIRVVVRARPLAKRNVTSSSNRNTENLSDQECVAASPENPGELFVYTDAAHTRAATFRCEAFLPSTATQQDVFDQVRAKELVEAALDGFPVTIFAYGQTGAGKSFTIFGQEDGITERKLALHPQDGLLPRTAQELMHSIAERKGKVEYTLRVTCVEIYNEQVRDVFDPRKETLAVRSSKTHGFFLENATVVECVTAREIVRVVKAAAAHRAKSSHLLNERSNRSHCLVTIYIDATPLRPDTPDAPIGGKRYGKITIVDLAGSERVTDSGAVGTQLRETCHINRSLHCLSQVIQAMNASKCSKAGRRKFVPYRDSKLTMLLLDSLGGNSKTLMLACVNASPQFTTESVRTLEFAMGVAKIKNRPTALLNPHEKLISDLKEQIRLLKQENMMLRARTPGYYDPNHQTWGACSCRCSDFLEHPDHDTNSSVVLSSRTDGHTKHHDRKDCPPASRNDGFVEVAQNSLLTLRRSERSARQKIVQEELQTLHRKTQLRRRPKSPKQRTLKRMSASFSNKRSLPPVNARSPPQRSLQYAVPNYNTIISNQATNSVLRRTNSPPPPYNDLFDIETVQIPQQHASTTRVSLPTKPTDGQSLSNNFQNTEKGSNTLSPEQQLQQLLQQMLPQSQPLPPFAANSRPKIPSKSGKGRAPTGLSSNNSKNSEDWDDQRAHDLFKQLCRL